MPADELDRVAPLAEGLRHRECLCELAVDPDGNTIGVFVDGVLVGWLPDGTPPAYVHGIAAMESRGLIPLVPFNGWWNHEAVEFEIGRTVYGFWGSHRVTLSEPHMLLPLNAAPAERHLMLPVGPTAQITGEELHMDAIRPWLLPEGTSHVYTTLHTIVVQRPRSTQTLLEARVDGRPVGTLSKPVSDQVRPLVDELATHGVTVACQGTVRGNVIAAEVAVHPRRPSGLSNDWLAERLRTFYDRIE